MDERGRVRQYGEHGALAPREAAGAAAEIVPCGALQSDHIAAEGGVGGVQGEYLLLAAFEFQPGRQHRLDDLFPEGPRFPAAAQADRLHRKRAGAAGHPSRSEVLPHGAAERQRIDPEMAVETFVLVSSNSDTEFVRHAVRREKAPLSVGSDLGRHQTAVAAPDGRGERLVEKRPGQA